MQLQQQLVCVNQALAANETKQGSNFGSHISFVRTSLALSLSLSPDLRARKNIIMGRLVIDAIFIICALPVNVYAAKEGSTPAI